MLKDFAATLLSAAQTRLALLVNDVQLEKLSFMRQIRLTLALAFCLAMLVMLLIGLALILWWDERLTVVLAFVVLFGVLGLWLFAALRAEPASSEAVFASSMSELQEDVRLLREASNAEKPH